MSIQFGILLDGPGIQRWQLRCLRSLLALADVRPVALIRGSVDRLPSAADAAPDQAGPPDQLVTLPPEIAALPADLPAGADFVLSFSRSPCPPRLLEAARWGVWRYEFGDWVRFRGGPPGFWEVYEGHSESAVLLVRETTSPGWVVVLREGFVRTLTHSSARNRDQLMEVAPQFVAQVCRDLQNGVTERLTGAPLKSTAAPRGSPTALQKLVCATRILGRMAAEGYTSLFVHTQWNVGVVEQPIDAFLQSKQRAPVRWMIPPKRCQFRADPFGIVRDGRLTILLEDFSYIVNRGTIEAMDAETGATVPVTIGPDPPVHLSYPYPIEVDGRLFCMPEAHEAREVVLYEATRYPDRWARVAVFPIETVIVDATLFRHEERWWIAGSEPGNKGASSELHLWCAPALEGPWQAHANNPVKVDIRSARPAGTPFHHGGLLYRPAQDCSKSYGGRVAINQVTLLTPTAFREAVITTVEPYESSAYGGGIHTLSSVGNVTLIDGKRTLFVPEEFRRNARHFWRQALRRLGL